MHQFLKILYSLKFPFLKRLIPSLIKRIFFINSEQIIKLSFCTIQLDLKQSIDREIYLNGFYEKEQLNYLDELCSDKITHFFDVGANIGYYSLYFKRIKNIYSFEPNENTFLKLKKNIALNKLNFNIYNIGLSNSNSESKIWYSDKNKTGGSAVFNEKDIELKKYNQKNIIKEKIILKKLDDIIDLKFSEILIKIDVERHEKEALEGMNNLIQNNNVIMQIEIGSEKKDEIFEYLKKLNLKWIKSIRHDHFFSKQK